MAELSVINNLRITMSSREIADLVEKRHDNVMRTIESLHEKELIALPQFEEVPNPGAGPLLLKQYRVGKRDSYVIVAQLSPELTARLVDRWQELEQKIRQPATMALPQDYIEALEHLLIAKKSEQAAIAERDHAIATKAQIGNKREATAMATASAAMKQVRRLEGELGRNQKHATIIAVERATGKKLAKNTFVALRRWCKENNNFAVDVVDARYGTVKAWPADAWLSEFGIDLCELFATGGAGA